MAKYILNQKGEKIDYKILGIRWTDKVKTIKLEPGVYHVSMLEVTPLIDEKGEAVVAAGHPIVKKALVDAREFKVENEPLLITLGEPQGQL